MFPRLRQYHYVRRRFTTLSTLPPTIKETLRKPLPGENGVSYPTVVHGWIKSVRRQKKVTFAVVNDGTTVQGLQTVFSHPNEEHTQSLKSLSTGVSVRLTGKLIDSPGKGQERELQVEEVVILGECDAEVCMAKL
jgi:asparaginyl-tRNA synthetase